MRILAFLFLLISAVTASAQSTPAAPTNLVATAIGGGDIRLTWTASAGVPIPRGYHVYRVPVAGGGSFGDPITSFNQVTGATFTDTNPPPGVAVKYMVRAYVGDTAEELVLSGNSNEATATAVESPDAPLNLRSTGRTSTTVTLAWGAVAGATYTVVRNGVEVEDDITTTTYTDDGLELSTTYTYVVFATSSAGEDSDDSNEISVTTFGDGSDKEAAFAKRYRQIDIDANGLLSFDEYLLGHGARLAWVVVKHRFDYSDTDGTEGLTLSEYAKSLGGRKFLAPNKARQFYLADGDEDGQLNGLEYPLMISSRTKPSKVAKMFAKKDKDGDLFLTPEELGIKVLPQPDEL